MLSSLTGFKSIKIVSQRKCVDFATFTKEIKFMRNGYINRFHASSHPRPRLNSTKASSFTIDPVVTEVLGEGAKDMTGQFIRHKIYEGPFWKMLQMLKRVSVFSCACSVIGIPLLAVVGNENMSAFQRGSVTFVVVLFAIGTTATLHFVVKPYVAQIYVQRLFHMQNTGHFHKMEIVTMNLVGRLKVTEIDSLKELSATGGDRIFSSFKNTDGKYFYVHEEEEFWDDQEIHSLIMKMMEEHSKKEISKAEEEAKKSNKEDDSW